MKRIINTRILEHGRYCRLGQTEKLAIEEHALETGLEVYFENTKLLAGIGDCLQSQLIILHSSAYRSPRNF